jgi:formylglycine-generating enzyme
MDALPGQELPSCIGLATTCGASGSDSCCNSPEVPGEVMYYRSYDVAPDGSFGDMSAPATVSNFRLDKYVVTVGRFRAFVHAGMGTRLNPPSVGVGAHAKIPGSGWDPAWNASLATNTAALIAAIKCDASFQTWTDAPGTNEDRPINCITWYEAAAFCAWDGGYLPTDAEWNYAAAGGAQQRAFPWSNPPGSLTPIDSAHASYSLDGEGTNASVCIGDGMPACAVTDLVVVGTKPAGDGRWGQSDLAGNVWEWTLDRFAPYLTPCTDCANITSGSTRVGRGAAFDWSAMFLRVSIRGDAVPGTRGRDFGVRCARAR